MKENNNALISTQIITASLTMITVIGAFAVFVIEKREINFWYYIVIGTAFACFIFSIIFGGKGLSTDDDAVNGYNKFYNLQTRAAILGILMFCISIFLGKEKSNDTEKKIFQLEKFVTENRLKYELKQKDFEKLKVEVNELKKNILELERKIDEKNTTTRNNALSKKP